LQNAELLMEAETSGTLINALSAFISFVLSIQTVTPSSDVTLSFPQDSRGYP
jgi:hypothetical protein